MVLCYDIIEERVNNLNRIIAQLELIDKYIPVLKAHHKKK
jgi:hypothetical protein